MVSGNGTKTGKLSKLNQLEAEVATLSEQLKTNKKTIASLKKSLAERDVKIHELELKLVYAQQSLLKRALFTIHQCRDQIKNGIDEKIITPALAQIQQQIEVIQDIVHEAKDFIGKKKLLIHENIHTTSNIVHQCPDQAIMYFEKWVVEPARLMVSDVMVLIDNNVKNVEQNIIYPCNLWYDKVIIVVQGLPMQSQVMFQVWLAAPVKQKIEALPVIGKELSANADALLKHLLDQLKAGAEKGLEKTAGAIKQSPFWDGKHKIEAA
ncbi:MAG: hypothetical protein ACXWAT_07350 [Methylobacter sp.]